jgi:hypothetical protein
MQVPAALNVILDACVSDSGLNSLKVAYKDVAASVSLGQQFVLLLEFKDDFVPVSVDDFFLAPDGFDLGFPPLLDVYKLEVSINKAMLDATAQVGLIQVVFHEFEKHFLGQCLGFCAISCYHKAVLHKLCLA